MNTPFQIIHRQCDIDREPLVNDLLKVFKRATVFEAIDGQQLKHLPRRHPWENKETSLGNIGNTASHCHIYLNALKEGKEVMGILEDDAVVVGDVDSYLEVAGQWDILYLGVNEVVEGIEKDTGILVKRSWGTHAVLCNEKAMRAICDTYSRTILERYAYPADWLYNRAIKDYNLIAYCPKQNIVIQKPGLISIATQNLRKE